MRNINFTHIQSVMADELDRLNDTSLSGDALKEEVARSKAITGVAQTAINNGHLLISAAKFEDERMADKSQLPSFMLADKSE